MKLTKHFTLEEFTRSQLAIRHGIVNEPSPEQIENLRQLCIHVLEPIRIRFGPVLISSGFRCPELNGLMSKARDSHHQYGYAADFEVAGFSNLIIAEYIRDNLSFSRCVLEFYTPGVPNSGWVHVSYISYQLEELVFTMYRKDGSVITESGFITV